MIALFVYPFAVGGLAAHLAAGKLSDRLGQPVTVGRGRGGFGTSRCRTWWSRELPVSRRWSA